VQLDNLPQREYRIRRSAGNNSSFFCSTHRLAAASKSSSRVSQQVRDRGLARSSGASQDARLLAQTSAWAWRTGRWSVSCAYCTCLQAVQQRLQRAAARAARPRPLSASVGRLVGRTVLGYTRPGGPWVQAKGLAKFFETGSKAGVQAQHAERLRPDLGPLSAATSHQDMHSQGWAFIPLGGDREGRRGPCR